MKVAIINSVYGNGSTGKIVAEIEKNLMQSGHDCKCYYGRKSGNEKGGEFFGSKFSVLAHAFFSRIFGKQGLRSNRATKQLIKRIKEYNPDVINLHNIHGYYLNYKLLFNYLNKANIPVVWTLHDLWPITGHCAYFDEEKCKVNSGCKNCFGKAEYPSAMFENSAKNFLEKKRLFTSVKDLTLICPSVWLKNLMEQSFFTNASIKVINNGIDLQKFNRVPSTFRQKYGLEGKKIILGVSMQWSKRKGLDDFNKLASTLPSDYAIVLVGVDNQEVDSKIISIKRTESLQELCEIYSACDLFVNPTVMENLPTVNIEALACGLPVITYNTGGSAEIIDSSCGVSVEKGNFEQLKNAILDFDYQKFSFQDCQLRAKNFDGKDKYKEYIQLFEEVAKC